MLNNFLTEIYKFGIGRLVKSFDFVFSIILILFLIILECKKILVFEINLIHMSSILVGLFAFIFTALAIIIGFIDKKFILKIKNTNFYYNILFHYYYGISIFLFSILVYSINILFNINIEAFNYFYIFLFIYSILISYEILKITINLGLYKQKMILNEIEKD